MNNKFIPVNETTEERVQESLKRLSLPTDLDQFIVLYNQGIINANSPEIKEVTDLIKDSYMNVILHKRRFFIESEEEVHLKKALFVLQLWEPLLTLKRIASNLVDDGHESSKIVFKEGKPGVVFYTEEDENEEGEVVTVVKEYDNAEKTNITSEVIASNVFLSSYYDISDEGDIEFDTERLAFADTDKLEVIFNAIEDSK